jgi:hypothetical protein
MAIKTRTIFFSSMAHPGCLPNLTIIRSIKSGAISLNQYLDMNPDTFMPREKELDFFMEEHNWKK